MGRRVALRVPRLPDKAAMESRPSCWLVSWTASPHARRLYHLPTVGPDVPTQNVILQRGGKKWGKKLWELISVLSNSWRASGHDVSNLTKLPRSHWFYIPFGSRKSSKAFKFCFPSSAPLGGKIIQSKGLLCFTQACKQLAIFLQNSFFKVFLVLLPPGCVCTALARVCFWFDED